MTNNSVTLRDIANALKLSTSTVSKALRDSYEISDKTKRKVNSYAKKVGYQPNTIAKSLKEGKSRSIGVVICSIDNTFVSQMLNGIDSACNARGYSIMIMQSKESHEQEKKCIELLQARSIDGLLVSPASETTNVDHLKTFLHAGLPIVLFDRFNDELEVPKVSIDNLEAAYQATEHLIKNGYHRIALLHSNTLLNINIERLEGYEKALKQHQITVNPDYIKPCDFQNSTTLQKSIVEAIEQLMALPAPPNAILTTSDQISTQSVGIIRNLGYNIPEDIALIGFTNTNLASSLNPPLSTIYQPAIAIGEQAALKLINMVEGKDDDPHQVIKLHTTLIERTSSKPKNF
ncbi:LacI family DNA-binding transcriptional regulator [Olivibacter sp. SDN3]|uniref:LacI family DNA-binding transcriptional regulator n=1 Tax=Olivibacter sp. SDN3 TaxID=2764720 RepID=UPI001651740D|nr:LacI family DNA-binding transcriptional regulator [Olivibacter sp. SDN3]QNL50538.1 LacI family DNA-binding transcriptional regulator [Olivibacter sp. SDN3]